MKKIVTIILIILIIAALAWNAWILFFRISQAPETPIEVLESEESIDTPITSEELRRIQSTRRIAIEQISETEILSVNETGALVVINPEAGTETELAQLPEIIRVISLEAKGLDRILMEAENFTGKSFYIFLGQERGWLELQSSATSATLSPDGQQILTFNESSKELEIFSYSSQELENSFALNLFVSEISWISQNNILLQSAPSSETEGFVLTLNPTDESLTILREAFGLSSISWTDPTSLISLSSSRLSEPTLSVQGQGLSQNLSFITMPEKCIFESADVFYCAVPIDQSTTSKYPDSYLQQETYSNDYFLRAEMFANSVSEETILSSANTPIRIDASDMELLGDKLYFINRYDNQLYELSLEE